jgi:hypothetical protein
MPERHHDAGQASVCERSTLPLSGAVRDWITISENQKYPLPLVIAGFCGHFCGFNDL